MNCLDESHNAIAHVWFAHAFGGRPPFKDDICPMLLPRQCFPNLMLFKVGLDNESPRCSVFGNELRYQFGSDLTGSSILDMPGSNCTMLFAMLFDRSLRTGIPHYSSTKFCFLERDFLWSVKSIWPLRNQSGHIDEILVLNTFRAGGADAASPLSQWAPLDAAHDLGQLAWVDDKLELRTELSLDSFDALLAAMERITKDLPAWHDRSICYQQKS